jgi:hypothetical protein
MALGSALGAHLGLGGALGAGMRRTGPNYAHPYTQPLEEEEYQGALKSLANTGFSALSGIGNALDLVSGLSSFRDILAGENPFDQFLDPFTAKNRVQFSELLGKKNAGWKDPETYLGLALDIGLDPLTYLSLGGSAVGKFGKAFSKAGVSAKAIEKQVAKRLRKRWVGPREARMEASLTDMLAAARSEGKSTRGLIQRMGVAPIPGERLGGLARIGIPFTDIGRAIGTGPRALKVAQKMDAVGHALRFSKVGRLGGAVFNPLTSVGGKAAKTEKGQILAEEISRSTSLAEAATKEFIAKQEGDYARAFAGAGPNDPIRHMDNHDVRAFLESWDPFPGSEAIDLLREKGWDRNFHDAFAFGLGEAKYIGMGRVKQFVGIDGEQYFSRILISEKGRDLSQLESAFSGVQDRFFQERLKPTRDIVGGTRNLDSLVKQQAVKDVFKNMPTATKEQVAARMEPIVRRWAQGGALAAAGRGLPRQARRAKREQKIKAISRILATTDETQRRYGLFAHDPLHDAQVRLITLNDASRTAHVIYDNIAKPGMLKPRTAREGQTTLRELLLTKPLQMRPGNENSGALLNIAKRLGMLTPTKQQLKNLGEMIVDQDIVDDTRRILGAHLDPEKRWAVVDTIHALFKQVQLFPWPSYHNRNITSAVGVNALAGFVPIHKTISAYKNVSDYLSGKEPALKGLLEVPDVKDTLRARGMALTDENATAYAMEKMYAHKVVDTPPMGIAEQQELLRRGAQGPPAVGPAADISPTDKVITPTQISDLIPGRRKHDPIYSSIGGVPLPFVPSLKHMKTWVGRDEGTNLKLWDVHGVGGRQIDRFGPVVAGKRMSGKAESMVRMTPVIEQVKRGVDWGEAAKRVDAAQIDYSPRNFTNVERTYLRRLFPFYSWMSRMLPYQLRELYKHPGGGTAQAIRTQRHLEAALGGGGFVPDQYRGQVTLPLGEPSESGEQQVLSQIDLAHQSALEPFQIGGSIDDSFTRTLRGIGGMMSPLVKPVVEQAFGQQLYSGRDLPSVEGGIKRLANNLSELTGAPTGLMDWLPNIAENAGVQIVGKPITLTRQVTSRQEGSKLETPAGMLKFLINQLTGARIAGFNAGEQEHWAALKAGVELAKTSKNLGFSVAPYVRGEKRKDLTEAETQLMRFVYESNRRRRAKKAREEAAAATQTMP